MSEPLRVLVLEDEWPARNYLVQLLERSGLAHVMAAVPSPELALDALKNAPEPVDVAFVDVYLAGVREPELAGLSWIEEVAKLNIARPRFVLTTAKESHAMRAYELGVVDYLLKPFTDARVRRSLERVGSLQTARVEAPRAPARIAARDGRNIVFLKTDQAFAFEADGRLCCVHSERGTLDVDLSLSALEAVLGDGYLRVHRSWLVSLDHVLSMERDNGEPILLVGSAENPRRVSVARDRAAMVRERLLSRSVGIRRDDALK